MQTMMTIVQLFQTSFGLYGHRYYQNGTAQPSGEHYNVIQVLEDATSITYTSVAGGDNAAGKTVNKGDVIYGRFSVLSVSAGQVRAYIAPAANDQTYQIGIG
jgi:hypothetical protein